MPRMTLKALEAKLQAVPPDQLRQHPVSGYVWHVAGRCTAQHEVIYYCPGALELTLRLRVPCRRCEPCLYRRRGDWIARCNREFARAKRAWLVTLTYGVSVRRSFEDVSTGTERLRNAARNSANLVSKYCDRLRHRVPGTRYVAACEAHKDGVTPHWHLLVLEPEGRKITKALLRGIWDHGFSHAVLAKSARAATYVAKYLCKSPILRVRASPRFGAAGEPNPHALKAKEQTTNELQAQVRQKVALLYPGIFRSKGEGGEENEVFSFINEVDKDPLLNGNPGAAPWESLDFLRRTVQAVSRGIQEDEVEL